jgi:hypothetical protein
MLLSLVTASSLKKIHCPCATCGKKIIYSHGDEEPKRKPENLICRTCESKLISVTIDGKEYQLPSDIDPFILLRLFGRDPAQWKVSPKNFQFVEISSQIEKISDRVTQDAQCDGCQAFLPTGRENFYCESHEEMMDICENCVKLHNGHALYRSENLSCGFTDLWETNSAEFVSQRSKMLISIWSDLNRIIRGLFIIRARGDPDLVKIWMGENSLLIDPDSFDSLSEDENETREFIIRLLKRLNRNWFRASMRLSMVIDCISKKKEKIPLLPCFFMMETESKVNPIADYKMEMIQDRKRSREMKEKSERVEYIIPGGFANDHIHAFERAIKKKN